MSNNNYTKSIIDTPELCPLCGEHVCVFTNADQSIAKDTDSSYWANDKDVVICKACYHCGQIRINNGIPEVNWDKEQVIDHEYTTDPVCPYCGYVMHDAWELNLEDGEYTEVECGHCEKSYKVSINISVHYSTEKIKDNTETAGE